MVQSRRMVWAGHVARMGKKRKAYRISMGSQKDRDHWEEVHVCRRIILKWILES
jgi:hypothetical protein